MKTMGSIGQSRGRSNQSTWEQNSSCVQSKVAKFLGSTMVNGQRRFVIEYADRESLQEANSELMDLYKYSIISHSESSIDQQFIM